MFITKVSPRFGDVDCLGHINNVVLAGWFELARNPLFNIFSKGPVLSRESWPLIMAHTEYDFTDQMFFQYEAEIRTYVDRIGNKSFTLFHEARQENRLCATGRAVIVCFEFSRNQSLPIPEDKRKLLAEHLLSSPTGNRE